MKIKANGISINYELSGSGRCLTLIHGGGDNLNAWYSQVPVFSKKYQVLTYDVRGYGQTELPEGSINTKLWVKDLYALLKTLNISETILVGHSLGGEIALNFVLTHPDMANALILSNGGLRPTPKSEDEKNQMKASARENVERLKKEGMESNVGNRLKIFFSPGFTENNPEITKRYVSIFLQNKLEGYIRVLESRIIPDAPPDLSGITCPTMIIAGEHDPYVNPLVGKSMQEAIRGARLKVLPTGHAPQIECPDDYNEAVLVFLTEVGLD